MCLVRQSASFETWRAVHPLAAKCALAAPLVRPTAHPRMGRLSTSPNGSAVTGLLRLACLIHGSKHGKCILVSEFAP